MKHLFLIAATALGTAACSQSSHQAALAAPDSSPGYSAASTAYAPSATADSADTRKMDQTVTPSPYGGNGTAAVRGASNLGSTNWRTSDGFNTDPNNPSGAPGPSTVGTSPAR
jgi:hypothetical protein